MSALFLVAFRYVVTPLLTTELEPDFGALGSWIRYGGNVWFVYSPLSAENIYDQLKTKITPDDNVIVLAVDPSRRYGWTQKWIWDWFDDNGREPLPTHCDIIVTMTEEVDHIARLSGFDGLVIFAPKLMGEWHVAA